MSDAPKPCPFCGSTDLVKRLRTPMAGVTVQACFKERCEAADRIAELKGEK